MALPPTKCTRPSTGLSPRALKFLREKFSKSESAGARSLLATERARVGESLCRRSGAETIWMSFLPGIRLHLGICLAARLRYCMLLTASHCAAGAVPSAHPVGVSLLSHGIPCQASCAGGTLRCGCTCLFKSMKGRTSMNGTCLLFSAILWPSLDVNMHSIYSLLPFHVPILHS